MSTHASAWWYMHNNKTTVPLSVDVSMSTITLLMLRASRVHRAQLTACVRMVYVCASAEHVRLCIVYYVVLQCHICSVAVMLLELQCCNLYCTHSSGDALW
jgi:hypothetical protein